jgi:HK97 family phage prohead protease
VWHFSGYASIFNTKDQGNDIVMPGAFSKSLRENGLPLLLFQHKHDDAPVGTITDAKEDKRRLWVKGELPKDDTFVAGRLVPQLRRRGLKGMSIAATLNQGGVPGWPLHGMGGWRLTRLLPKASSAPIALREMHCRFLFQQAQG